jgi:hypothetical protein
MLDVCCIGYADCIVLLVSCAISRAADPDEVWLGLGTIFRASGEQGNGFMAGLCSSGLVPDRHPGLLGLPIKRVGCNCEKL